MPRSLFSKAPRPHRRRVVITGTGVVTPLGHHVDEVFRRLVRGDSAVAPIRRFDASSYALNHAAEVAAPDPAAYGISHRDVQFMDSVQLYALVAAELAVRESGLDLPRRPIRGNSRPSTGQVQMGTAIGVSNTTYEPIHDAMQKIAQGRLRQVSPHTLNQSRPCGCAALVSIRYGLQGPMLSQNAASATGALNLASAFDAIQCGRADVMISGGADSGVNPLSTAIFSQNLTGSRTGSCRPFDRDRDGVVLSEGAAILILEEAEHASARGARVLGELVGYGLRSDAFDTAAIPLEAPGLKLSIQEALEDAGLECRDIAYINAHATGTRRNDEAEGAAIREVFGEGPHAPYVSGTKGQLGHMLAGSGAIEVVVSLLASRHDVIPPTGGLQTMDPECRLRHVIGRSISTPVGHAMSLSIGMGGMNSAIIVRGEKAPWTPDTP